MIETEESNDADRISDAFNPRTKKNPTNENLLYETIRVKVNLISDSIKLTHDNLLFTFFSFSLILVSSSYGTSTLETIYSSSINDQFHDY